MKHVKAFVLLAVIATALLASAGTATATTITSPTGTTYTGEFVAEAVIPVEIHGPTTTECAQSTIKAQVESHGSGVTVTGNVSTLTFSGCDRHVVVVSKGSISIHHRSGYDGTRTLNGTSFTITDTSLGLTCTYTTSNTEIGTDTGGGPASLDVESAAIPRTGGSFFCGSSAQVTGFYKTTTPNPFLVDS
ncbi:MAG TPA: hypothetical protein VK480_09605 [Solirubrobacterales bacterium]|nr:hypothetical protein [Solirubrobacterales bacterium]